MNDNRGSNYIVGRMDGICRLSRQSMRCTSRTMEEHSVKLERQPDGTWKLASDPFQALLELTLQNNPSKSVREQAEILRVRTLSEGVEKSFEACRSAVTRYLKRTKK